MQLAFNYEGVMQTTNKTVRGVIVSKNRTEATYALEESGVKVYTLRINPVKTLLNIRKKSFSPYELKDLMFAFYNAQKTRLSIRMIVDSLPDMFTGYAKKQTELIRTMIKEKGYQLSIVFKKAGLPDFIVHAVEAAEVGGGLEEVLEKVVKILDIMSRSESELKKALIYPKIVLVLIIFVVFFITWKVVPQLAGVYADVPNIPAMTKNLLALGKTINANLTLSIAFIVGVAYIMWKVVSVNTFLNFVSLIYLLGEKLPSIKSLTKRFSEFIESYETMKICYFLDLLYTAGIKPNKIIEHIKDIVDTKNTKKKLEKAKIHIENGIPIFQSFKLAGFEKQLVGFIKAGEDQNSLNFYMNALAEYKERNFINSIENIKVILPMLLMILASGVIISIMYYIILPLYSIAG